MANTLVTRSLIAVAAFSTVALSQAGTLTAAFTSSAPIATRFTYNSSDTTVNAVMFTGDRQGGSDTVVPDTFNAYCVEIFEFITIPSTSTFNNVSIALGSTTVGGGVTFTPAKMLAIEKLWGTYASFAEAGSDNDKAAFQLALWELTFDTDLNLTSSLGQFYVKSAHSQLGITNVAEGWVNAIAADTTDSMARTHLMLLSDRNVQDLLTPVPEPTTMAVLGLGLAAALRRRRSK